MGIIIQCPLPPNRGENDNAPSREAVWDWYDRQTDTVKQRANERLFLLKGIKALIRVGWVPKAAVHQLTRLNRVSPRTVSAWTTRLRGVDGADWLPYLAPRYRGRVILPFPEGVPE